LPAGVTFGAPFKDIQAKKNIYIHYPMTDLIKSKQSQSSDNLDLASISKTRNFQKVFCCSSLKMAVQLEV